MPPSPRPPAKQRRTGARIILAISGVLGVLGSLMTVWLSPALAGQGTTPAPEAVTSPTTASVGILWAWDTTPAGPVTPTAPPGWAPTPAPPVATPPAATPPAATPPVVPPVVAPPVAAGINSVNRILASMNSAHEGAPHGVPSYWSWAQLPSLQNATPPAGMSALTSWGQIYADTTNAQPANIRVELRNMETYIWSNSNQTWTRVQATPRVDGAHYVEDFAGNSAIGTDLRNETDGGNSTGMVSGYNFHFWPTGPRGNLPNPADIGAVYTTVQARLILDDPNGPDNRNQARYLANTGADWWRTTTAPYGDGTNNPGVGQGRFTYLTNNWTALDFYTGGPIATAPGSWTQTQLANNPPPIDAMG